MGKKKFKKVIPKIPVFRRNMYLIPREYSDAYEEHGIINTDEQKALFHVTQFGGFRLRNIPSYFQGMPEFFDTWFKAKNEWGHHHFKASPEFLSTFGALQVQPLLRRRYGKSRFKPGFLLDNGFSPEGAQEIEAFQDQLNEHFAHTRVSLVWPNSGVTPEDRIDLSRFNAIPHFQYKPRSGGRLFHSGPGSSYQAISSNLRPLLTIDGEPTTEIDISAATIQFLNVTLERHLGQAPIQKRTFTDGDPYQPFLDAISGSAQLSVNSNGNLTRDGLKDVLYTLIFSAPNAQERNVNRRLTLLGQGYKYSELRDLFPTFFEMVERVKEIPLNGGDERYQAHTLIFREESEYAREVLRRGCFERGFPVLPLHDSFITPRCYADELEEIVSDVSMDRYGYVMAHKTKF